MSEIIFWRHAEAHDALPEQDDLERKLTVKGQRQAERVAFWLDRNLPQHCRVFVSPARRALQTARCLARKHKVISELVPGATPEQVLTVIGWGTADAPREPIIVVGHQPWIGQCIQQLLFKGSDAAASSFAVRKGAAWWLQSREREAHNEVVVRAVTTPEFL